MHNKNITTGISSAEATPEDMELINRHTISRVEADDVFTFSVTLCDNEVDRDGERFTAEALRKLSELFVGKTGIFDHSMKGSDQTSRVFKTWLEEDEEQKTTAGENYTRLKARVYMLRTQKNADLIAEINAGIKKEASVSCSVAEMRCSICGENLREKRCKHIKGRAYGGKTCHTVLDKPTDAYEWSFVAVPAQPRAGVTKLFEGREELVSVKSSDFTELEALAKDGRAYKFALSASIIKLAAAVLPSLASKSLEKICSGLSSAELRELEAAFAQKAAEGLPAAPQLAVKKTAEAGDNREFKI